MVELLRLTPNGTLANGLLVIPVGSTVQFQLPQSSPLSQPTTQLMIDLDKYSDGNLQVFQGEVDARGRWSTQVTFHRPGSFQFSFGKRPTDFVVEPRLILGSSVLPLSAICLQTVVSRCLGTIDCWELSLVSQKKLGFNVIHLTPVQTPGASRSLYSIANHTQLNPEYFPDYSKYSAYKALYDVVESLDQNHEVACFVDIVLNHCASSSPFLREYPEAAYNLANCPHQVAAYELERALLAFSELLADRRVQAYGYRNTVESAADVTQLIGIIREQVLAPFHLNDFFCLDTSREVALFFDTPEGEVEAASADLALYCRRGLTGVIQHNGLIGEGEGRHSTQVNRKLVRAVLTAAGHKITHEDYRLILTEVQQSQQKKVNGFLTDICKNLHREILAYHVESRRFEVKHNLPLIKRSFVTLPHAVLLCNGFTVGHDTALADFTQKQDWHYLRRTLHPWGDCVKLRYGDGPGDCPALWSYIEEYIIGMAKIFKGFRLDNAHSTPLHVCDYFLTLARKHNPDLIVFAEFFANDHRKEHHFVQKLGINMLLRETVHASTPHALMQHALQNEDSGLIRHHPRALLYDCTHDNEVMGKVRTVPDSLPTLGIVAMANCPVATTRGFDELVPHRISVITERRLYSRRTDSPCEFPAQEGEVKSLVFIVAPSASEVCVLGSWDDWTHPVHLGFDNGVWGVFLAFAAESRATSVQFKFVVDGHWLYNPYLPHTPGNSHVNNTLEIGTCSTLRLYKSLHIPRSVMCEIHKQIEMFGLTNVHSHMLSEDFIMLTRSQADSAVVLFARTCFQLKAQPLATGEVKLPGKVKRVELVSALSVEPGHAPHPKEINGQDATLVISDDASPYCSVQTQSVTFHFVPSAFLMLLLTSA